MRLTRKSRIARFKAAVPLARQPAFEEYEPSEVEYDPTPAPPEKEQLVTLSREERRAREKLRRKKLGLSKKKRR